ncbi:MAG: flagellar M-ring protein FliF [Desulfobacterales bacterium]|nr:MAG: flagellar M-ring protein FliF [Desulfobacterales bacterium]
MIVIRQILWQLKNLVQNLSRGKRVTLLTLIGGTLIGFLILITWAGETEFRALYTHLDPEEAGIVITRLREQKIPYQIASNGHTILIPQERLDETRMDFASHGLPQGGTIGFEVFDNTKLGMSEFAQNVNYQRALQGELSRTINRFAEVESARVHIVLPEKSLFIQDEEPATASVVLKLRPGKWLSADQVQGIVHLVSSSVARLSPENVTVVDSNGKLLAGLKDESNFRSFSTDQLEYQARVERKLEDRIKTMLERALGADKAIVRLACAFDFKRQEKTEELFYPDNRVVRSEQLLNESTSNPETIPQGVPGVRSNLPDAEPGASARNTLTSLGPEFKKQDRTVNYEIGKVTSHIVEPVGELTRISVAVMVDGTYERIEKEDGQYEWKYIARGAEEMRQLENIVKNAVNYDAARGDKVAVVNIPFETQKLAEAPISGAKKGWFEYLKQYRSFLAHVFLGLFLLLTFLFIVRPLVRWLTEHTVGDGEILRQLPRTVGEIENEYGADRPRLAFSDQVSQLVASDNEASLGVMRDWLKEK